ncbi:MAG: hypothetical protein K2Q01_04360, partial [Rickettsiales bacterium]|nr:hypothetical protein [Rickettsiales bacterium]
DTRLWRYEMLYHDEALFIMHGRDVLNGYLPYVQHWDNRPAFGWFLFAVLNFLSGEDLAMFRFIGALYIGLTGFVLYRALADRQKALAGMVAGVLYAISVSVAQVSQSITYEHVVGLPFAGMLYLLLNPRPSRWHRVQIGLLFSVCVMTLTNYIFLGPALALVMPGKQGGRDVTAPPPFTYLRSWLSECLRWAWFVFKNGMLLLAVLGFCYGALYALYWVNDKHELLVRSLVDAAFVVSRQPMDERLVTQFFTRWQGFSERFLNSYIYSNEWLIPFLVAVFLCRAMGMAAEVRAKRDAVIIRIAVLLVFSSLALFFRGGNFWNFPYYLLQFMPLMALAMGCAVAFRMGDARLVMMLVILWGVNDATRMVLGNYRPLMEYVKGDDSYSYMYKNDRLYQVAKQLNRFDIAGQDLIVCNEDDTLYVLTHTENPRYFIFPAFTRYTFLARVLGVYVDPLSKIVEETKPVALVGWKGDACFLLAGEALKTEYELYNTIEGTVTYLRKDLVAIARERGEVVPHPPVP